MQTSNLRVSPRAQVICKAQGVHYSVWPVTTYSEMQEICVGEFKDEEVCPAEFKPSM